MIREMLRAAVLIALFTHGMAAIGVLIGPGSTDPGGPPAPPSAGERPVLLVLVLLPLGIVCLFLAAGVWRLGKFRHIERALEGPRPRWLVVLCAIPAVVMFASGFGLQMGAWHASVGCGDPLTSSWLQDLFLGTVIAVLGVACLYLPLFRRARSADRL